MSVLPTPNKTLYLSNSATSSKKMRVFQMNSFTVRDLQKGKRVRVFAMSNNGSQYITQVTLRGLCAFAPVAAQTLTAHNSASGATINDVVLPAHAVRSYKRILGWMSACIKGGQVVKFRRIQRADALRIYKDIKSAAIVLGIGYPIKDIDQFINAMTKAARA